MEPEFKRQVGNEHHLLTIGDLFAQFPSGYKEDEAKNRGGHLPATVVEAAEVLEGDTDRIARKICSWRVSDLFSFEEQAKAQVFSKPDLWLKDRRHTLCALSAEGYSAFLFLCCCFL